MFTNNLLLSSLTLALIFASCAGCRNTCSSQGTDQTLHIHIIDLRESLNASGSYSTLKEDLRTLKMELSMKSEGRRKILKKLQMQIESTLDGKHRIDLEKEYIETINQSRAWKSLELQRIENYSTSNADKIFSEICDDASREVEGYAEAVVILRGLEVLSQADIDSPLKYFTTFKYQVIYISPGLSYNPVLVP